MANAPVTAEVCRQGHLREHHWDDQNDYCRACFPTRAELESRFEADTVMQKARSLLDDLRRQRQKRQKLRGLSRKILEELETWLT